MKETKRTVSISVAAPAAPRAMFALDHRDERELTMTQTQALAHTDLTPADPGGEVDGVLAEIGTRLTAMRAVAASSGVQLRAPLLLLGTSERVGSNWLSDTLRPLMNQHNEPLRQQLGPDHPFSALNPQVGGQHISGVPDLGPEGGCGRPPGSAVPTRGPR